MKSSRISKLFAGAAAVLCLAACSNGAKIEGTVTGAPGSQVIVKSLQVNEYAVLDTVKTNASGSFSYKVDVKKGNPEFVYLFHGDRKIGSLILLPGDKVKVVTDTLGTSFSVTGSDESQKLAEVDRTFDAFIKDFSATAAKAVDVADNTQAINDIQKDLSRMYVNYYRECVKYILTNPFSLTSIPVLFQNVNDNFPVFSQQTDALHFRMVHDSLATVYPESAFVKSLEREATRRESVLKMNYSLNIADEVGFIDINLPDTKGEKVALSSLDSKVVMIHFWVAEDAANKLFNQDVLKPVYEKYHSKGFDIYQVSLDTDKVIWGTTVKNQELPWTNVCDGLGLNTPAAALYGIEALPSSYFIVDGELSDVSVTSDAELRKFLDSKLK